VQGKILKSNKKLALQIKIKKKSNTQNYKLVYSMMFSGPGARKQILLRRS
jgi:hypothetical protein